MHVSIGLPASLESKWTNDPERWRWSVHEHVLQRPQRSKRERLRFFHLWLFVSSLFTLHFIK